MTTRRGFLGALLALPAVRALVAQPEPEQCGICMDGGACAGGTAEHPVWIPTRSVVGIGPHGVNLGPLRYTHRDNPMLERPCR